MIFDPVRVTPTDCRWDESVLRPINEKVFHHMIGPSITRGL
jgi:hypothetical protein